MRGTALLAGLMSVAMSGCSTLSTWWTSTSNEFIPASPDDLLARIDRERDQPNKREDHFAVLIGANTELRHQGNLSLAYQVLLEQGYERERIYILDSEGETAFFPVTDLTTRGSISRLFGHLSRIVEQEDSLLVYVTGHGRRIKAEEEENGDSKALGVSTLVLNPGEELSQDEFVELLETVQPGIGVAFFDQCYWGPISSTKLCNFVTITTSSEDETSHGVSFPRAFWNAFRQERARDKGPLTILDAFKVAMVRDNATRRGWNRPRISHGCVDPSHVILLGQLQSDLPLEGAGSVAASNDGWRIEVEASQ